MRAFAVLFLAAIAAVTSENDEAWTWNDKQKEGRSADPRYLVHEPEYLGGFGSNGIHTGFRPQNPGPLGPFGPNGRPIVPPHQGSNGVLVGPGGPTGIIGRPPRYEPDSGIRDSVPPWIRDDPRYREFDTCKCRYSFNCPSPALKFGSCSRDKKYCCFNSKRFPGLSEGNRYPYHPGAPHKFGPNLAPNYYGNRRPYANPYGGQQHPSFGNYQPGSYGGSYGHRNEFEPYGYDAEPDDYPVIYGRSLSKNQTQASGQPKINDEIKKQ